MPGPEWTRRGVLGLLGAGVLMPRQLLAGGEWVLSNATVVLPDGSTLSGELSVSSPTAASRSHAEYCCLHP